MSLASLLPAATGVALAAFALGAQIGKPAGLWAYEGGSRGTDVDADGLCDALEEVLSINGDRADSDGDGWSDSEELARGSDPKSSLLTPAASLLDVGIEGYCLDGVMHVVLAIYQKGGLGSEHGIGLGAVWNGRVYRLRPSAYLPFTDVTALAGKEPGDSVHILDVRLPAGTIVDLEQVSFFVTGAASTSAVVTNAAVLNVVGSNGSPVEVSLAGGTTQGSLVKGNGSTIYQPLVPRSNQPSASSAGQICVQTTRVIGGGGGAVHLQVTSGTCTEGDGSCPSSCSSASGSTYQLVDPLALIGG